MSRTARPHPSRHWAMAAVAVGLLSWVVFTGASIASRTHSWVWGLSLGLVIATWIFCRILTRDIAERRASEIDEYELTQRNQARTFGYYAALGGALVLYLGPSVVAAFTERGHDALLLQSHELMLAAFLPAAAGPSFFLAWRLRDAVDPVEDADPTDQDLLQS
ncbi:hypothetical protein SAMN04487905_10885 [Actinopolyspora xinjiangensis]|uniref:DUF3180 domain-containing protein n=1 Tax=Actinopolyspora xinjiangensis TaxID=405564 RepID=A0A1H0V898_9ACTN|nr:hypothetical protein [Actinopolyspora xinjiangensis]SDP74762.1 hypothetical protein SAMN04487905_10885 [Actinopolyspora xinjiangensis]